VDDNPVDRRLAGSLVERSLGWKVLSAANGPDALALLESAHPDMVLTDLLMEPMDGLQLLEAIRVKDPLLPVILMTGHGSEDIAYQALQGGAANYVPKKRLADDLADTVQQVFATYKGGRQEQRLRGSLTYLESRYRLENDPQLVRTLIVQVQQQLATMRLLERTRVRVGVALEKAILNALYHGNLEISRETRQLGGAAFHRQVEDRRQRSPFKDRRLDVQVKLAPTEAVFIIRHEGPGNLAGPCADQIQAERLTKSSRTGSLLVQTFMDEVRSNEAGNEITLIKRDEPNHPHQDEPNHPHQARRANPQGAFMKVLIAEDDSVCRRLLTGMLEGWGYEVEVVRDGLAAWEVLQRPDAPPLALLDWLMPGMDGLEVCRRVRELARPERPHLILLTIRDNKADTVTGLESGADDYLTKPVYPEELRARLRVGERLIRLQQAQLLLQKKLAARVGELEQALAQVKELEGLLPICAWCKNIRDDQNYWQRLEDYLQAHTKAKLTHGICPDCLRKEMTNGVDPQKVEMVP
jgi:CheY-like chemotaxis protein